jgi:hypothetical protein
MNKRTLIPIAEKVLWTFAQAGLVALLAVNQFDWSGGKVALAAGTTAVITLALASVQSAAVPEGLPFYTDLGLRIARSGAAAFLSFLLVAPDLVLDGQAWKGAAGAAGMAVLVALKGGAARFIGNPTTAATLPGWIDPSPDENGEVEPRDDEPIELGDMPDWVE